VLPVAEEDLHPLHEKAGDPVAEIVHLRPVLGHVHQGVLEPPQPVGQMPEVPTSMSE